MATVEIQGYNKNISNEIIKEATLFFAEKLLGRLSKKINIIVKFEKMNRIDYGATELQFDEDPMRHFIIFLNRSHAAERVISTLAHEMVHVKQMAKKELLYYNKTFRYKGIRYSRDMDYFEMPHEIEAFGREIGLYCKWFDFKKNLDLLKLYKENGYV